jgi:outer membrane usher protein
MRKMKLNKKAISLLTLSSLLLLNKSLAAVTFDTRLLAGASKKADLSRFYKETELPAGEQSFDIYVNNNWKGRFTLTLGKTKNDVKISHKDAYALDIDLSQLQNSLQKNANLPLQQLVQGGQVDMEVQTLSLYLSVPQAHMRHAEAGYVDTQFWDRGVSALLLSYNASYYSIKSKTASGANSDDFYLGLDSGLNLGGWQLRDSSTFSHYSNSGNHWQNSTRYLQRGIASIKSDLKAGDFYSSSELFDSVRLRGVSLASDVNMLPNSQQGFAPVVRGIAQTNALVKISQNGSVIYQENVAPGPFSIDNIPPTGSGGDLLVMVQEANGSTQSFTVPFSAVPNMLKQKIYKYSLIAGAINQLNTDYSPGFFQGTLQYGLNNLVTAYGGTTASNDYNAYLLGTGWNLPFGALSLDVTHAKTRLKNQSESGQSYRIAYSKFLDSTATNFTLAAYRYSTRGYYSFTDAIYSNEGFRQLEQRKRRERGDIPGTDATDLDLNTLDALRSARPRNTFNLSLNQRLGDRWGTLYFSGTQRDYWTENSKTREYQLGYANTLGNINYNLSASRVRNNSVKEETRYYLSFSVPLNVFDNSAYLSTGLAMTDSRYQQSNVSLSGTALESNRLSYSIAGANQSKEANMASLNASYRANASTLGGSYSESRDYRQTGVSVRGSLVAIPWHVLASNEVGNTLTVVEAPQAKGLVVNGDQSIVTNADGLALVPYATPYRQNTITLSNSENASGAEILGNVGNTVPYFGAVNYLKFDTDLRQSYLLQARQPDGTPLPFGTEVTDASGIPIGFVGQASTLYIKADKQPDYLQVRLNADQQRHCVIKHPEFGLNSVQNVCQ